MVKMKSKLKGPAYLAGPMRGIKFFNFPAFDEARDRLRQEGWSVISPADLDREMGFDETRHPEDYDWLDLGKIGFDLHGAVDRDVDALKRCTAIYMLDGWEKSRGALAEKHIAEWLGLEVLYQTDPASAMPVDPKGDAGSKKTPLQLLSPYASAECSHVLRLGADKYGAWNWRHSKIAGSTYVGAIKRHLDAWWSGENLDPESGRSHIAHVMASAMILLDAENEGTLVDDTP